MMVAFTEVMKLIQMFSNTGLIYCFGCLFFSLDFLAIYILWDIAFAKIIISCFLMKQNIVVLNSFCYRIRITRELYFCPNILSPLYFKII